MHPNAKLNPANSARSPQLSELLKNDIIAESITPDELLQRLPGIAPHTAEPGTLFVVQDNQLQGVSQTLAELYSIIRELDKNRLLFFSIAEPRPRTYYQGRL